MLDQKTKTPYASGKWLRGARLWKQVYPNVPHKFDIFEYRGFDEVRGLYIFVSRKGGMVVWKREYQLKDPYFYPFLINSNFLEEK